MSQSCYINVADSVSVIDEVAKESHGYFAIDWIVVEPNMHHSLD